MAAANAQSTSASELLGVSLRAPGSSSRVLELLIDPQIDGSQISALVLRGGSRRQRRLVSIQHVQPPTDGEISLRWDGVSEAVDDAVLESQLLIERDLLDQQIIDIDGHKVVRVNDVVLQWEARPDGGATLRVVSVEVGIRGASRRLLKGLPVRAVGALASKLPTREIPWQFVDLIERDPARRVRLKVGHGKLENLHPSDIADILEELAPAEREALFESLDEETAAETLEEVNPRLQKELLESMDEARAADIMEEMDPGAAADVLGELSDERSEAILDEMEPEDRQEVSELLEFPEESAAGRMTTYFVGVNESATAGEAVGALREFVESDEGDVDRVAEIFLLDDAGKLAGVVSAARLLLADGAEALAEMSDGHRVCCEMDASEREVAELFDKYNLLTLPVVDDAGVMQGTIHADQVIAQLREK